MTSPTEKPQPPFDDVRPLVDAERRKADSAMRDDPVNPKHYRGDLVARICEHFGFTEDAYLFNVIKYILRHKEKAGLQDLRKAAWYLERKIALLEGKDFGGLK